MTDLDIPWIRPELAKPSPYRWQEGVPDNPVGRFDLNTLPLNPSWWPGIARTIAAQSVPIGFTVPAASASERSVTSRITSTGLPSADASSCTPPESVSTIAARCMSRTNPG